MTAIRGGVQEWLEINYLYIREQNCSDCYIYVMI